MDKKRSVPHGKMQPKESRTRRTKAHSPSNIEQTNIEQSMEYSDSSSDNGRAFETAEFYARVARKAYELFQRRGGEEGHDVEDWLEAERLVRNDLLQRNP